MRHKTIVKWLIVLLISIFITACVSTKPKDQLPKKEEAQLYMRMGIRYLEMGMFKEAKNDLERAENIDPDNANIHNSLGALYERLKMFQQAEEQYQKAVSLDSDNAGAKNNYGRFLCETEQYEDGIEVLRESLALPLNNRKWFTYTNIGRCELRKGNEKLAEANLRRALQINKSFAPALIEMQKISYHAGKYMSARAFLQRYLSVANHTSKTLWYGVQIERALGNEVLVKSYKEKLISLFPASKEAHNLK